ncbi:putative Omp2b porin [Stappia aggregata IAM 12614]|uniref:Porin n=1 Tax=Roseibium aggregatum (strain ATCC 25650 / DSM 13394 / JCM 20685 / NBRC 16684 / NCIMB 2208 / IAM 12614 / B1) TaxID=384765 RepID=A0P0V4_ROSAI|nr:porin [Roseibium aggregatum]EAV41418.1 putative Omp2b porin [Stappia aggregata IAM 12614] [Roseibium aggregatum IAM 12614]
MKIKILMLGVAAAAAAATSAQAADLPVAPEAVDYVRVCDGYGARFYYIPGTETCLRVGGRVRTQVVVNNVLDGGAWGDRDSNGYDWLARGYLYLDARTATEFGTLRSYVSMYGDSLNGDDSGFELEEAYIQWGGLTAGRLASNFDIFTGQTFMGVVDRDWSDATTNQIAYTAAFGNGLSATVALEDRSEREFGYYGGTRAPDFVTALGLSQGWGSAQLSGVLHHVYPSTAYNNATDGEDNLGWAVGGGVVINLPMVGAGSNIFFQGFYADGALAYITTYDGVADFYGDETSKGFSLSAGTFIQATSTIGLALDGSYADIDAAGNLSDVTRYAIDGSVQWEPVSGFILGADVGYANIDVDNEGDQDQLLLGVRMQRTF